MLLCFPLFYSVFFLCFPLFHSVFLCSTGSSSNFRFRKKCVWIRGGKQKLNEYKNPAIVTSLFQRRKRDVDGNGTDIKVERFQRIPRRSSLSKKHQLIASNDLTLFSSLLLARIHLPWKQWD